MVFFVRALSINRVVQNLVIVQKALLYVSWVTTPMPVAKGSASLSNTYVHGFIWISSHLDTKDEKSHVCRFSLSKVYMCAMCNLQRKACCQTKMHKNPLNYQSKCLLSFNGKDPTYHLFERQCVYVWGGIILIYSSYGSTLLMSAVKSSGKKQAGVRLSWLQSVVCLLKWYPYISYSWGT